jgi:hypothetical protein
MGQSQDESKEKDAVRASQSAGPAQEQTDAAQAETPPPAEEQRPPMGPPHATIARLMLTGQVALYLLLAVAALNTAASLYYSQQSRWPTSPDGVLTKVNNLAERAKPYVEGIRDHAREIFQKDQGSNHRQIGLHDRVIVALAIFALIIRLLMESKLTGETLAQADVSRWVGSKLYAFELVAGIGLGGLLAWLGAAMKSNEQTPLLWLFGAYLVAHGVWMALNFVFLGGRAAEGTQKFLGLAVNSLAFAAVLVAGSFFATQFRDEIKIVSAASLVCLASSVIGVRIAADSFFGGERHGRGIRHAAFIVICLVFLAMICLTILARR